MPSGLQDFQKRTPSVERRVSEITQDDIRVSIVGAVIDSDGNTMVLDDGTGKVSITFDSPVKAASSSLVRVMGRVIPMEGGVEIQGDVMQDMSGMDLALKKQVDEFIAGLRKA